MTLSERLRRTRDALALKSVRIIPKRIRYWSTVMHIADVTTSSKFGGAAIGTISVTQLLDHMERPKVIR